MRVHVVDPAAYTPPYDHALCAALARAGADVELVTAPFRHGAAPRPDGYRRVELFGGASRGARLARHVPDMLRLARRAARGADVLHFQWLPLQQLDWLLLPRTRPRLITAHDVLPREATPGQRSAQRRIYARMDAVVVHSEHGARRLREEAGVPAERIHVIGHGAFDHLAAVVPAELPPELRDPRRPVVLFFGLIRPYKGVDVLLEAWRATAPEAELWIVGMPRMDIAPLRAAAPPSVRWLPRFVSDGELAAVFRTADLVVLPYREIDQSGVLYTALAFGKPLILSRVGGFGEVAGARLVAPGDPAALGAAIVDALADPPPPPRDPAHDWDAIAARTLALYEGLTKTM